MNGFSLHHFFKNCTSCCIEIGVNEAVRYVFTNEN